jgi:hypothetical protein
VPNNSHLSTVYFATKKVHVTFVYFQCHDNVELRRPISFPLSAKRFSGLKREAVGGASAKLRPLQHHATQIGKNLIFVLVGLSGCEGV